MIEFLYHAIGLCAETSHPSLLIGGVVLFVGYVLVRSFLKSKNPLNIFK